MPPPPQRTEPASTKRQAIECDVLRATEDLLADGATFADLNIERIARRAGISRTAFYFYFRDKREVLMRLTEGVAHLLYAEADDWWSGAGDGAHEMTRALRKIAALFRAHAALLRAIVEVSTYDEEVGRFWRGLVGRFVRATRERIEIEQAAGRVDGAVLPEATAFALVWMTERTLHQTLLEDDLVSDDDVIAALVQIWIAAVYGPARDRASST